MKMGSGSLSFHFLLGILALLDHASQQGRDPPRVRDHVGGHLVARRQEMRLNVKVYFLNMNIYENFHYKH